MDSSIVSKEQAAAISRWLVPALTNLGQLKERMTEVGFPSADPLIVRVAAAHESVKLLRSLLHDIERKDVHV